MAIHPTTFDQGHAHKGVSPQALENTRPNNESRALALNRLNAQGLERLWEGREDDAMVILREAFRLGNHALQQYGNEGRTSWNDSALMSSQNSFENLSLTPLYLQDLLSLEASVDEEDAEEESPVPDVCLKDNPNQFYDIVFLIEDSCFERSNNDESRFGDSSALRAVCTVLAYNMAVLYHQMAMVRTLPSHLSHAKMFYTYALRFLHNEAERPSHSRPEEEAVRGHDRSNNSSSSRALRMALLHNYAHLNFWVRG